MIYNAAIWTRYGLLWIRPSGTNLNEIRIKLQQCLSKNRTWKCRLQMAAILFNDLYLLYSIRFVFQNTLPIMPQDETPGSKETSGPNTELKVPLLIETGSDGQRSDVTNGSEARNGIPHLPPVPGANRERASSEGVINGHPCMQRTMQALDLQVDCPLNKEVTAVCSIFHISRVSCQKGPICHAYAWRVGPFWQDTIDYTVYVNNHAWPFTPAHNHVTHHRAAHNLCGSVVCCRVVCSSVRLCRGSPAHNPAAHHNPVFSGMLRRCVQIAYVV